MENITGETTGISTFLKGCRTRLGCTQSEMAKTLGTTKSEISDIENMQITLKRNGGQEVLDYTFE